MAQHDYNLANQSGADFRADLNNALSAIVTVNSGATAPSTTFSHQLWVDTSSNVLKIRNAANDAWVTTGVSITADNTFAGNLTGNVTGNLTGDVTGNADTATALETARTINGASFDGTANISFDTDSVSEGSSNLYYTSARFDSAFSGKSTSDLSEGTNLYYTDTRFDTRLATKDTDDLTEGTNLYYTTARFDSAFSGKSTSDLTEGTNLYYTDARSRAAISATGDISYNSTTGVISFTETTAPVTSVFGRTGVVVATSGDYTTAQVTESGNLYYTDARVQAVSINNVVEDTTPQLGGNLASNGNDILFADGDKAVFGTGSDLQIFHDGSNSIIKDAGAGNLELHATNLIFKNSAGDSQYASFFNGGAVTLRYAGAPKVSTTSTGIDVTGTVTSDGLTVDGPFATINSSGANSDLILTEGSTNTDARIRNSNGILQIGADINNEFGASEMQFSVDGKEFLSIDRTGDISFYDDTGSTQGLFWDASAERLGLGTTAVSAALHISGTSADQIRLERANHDTFRIGLQSAVGLGFHNVTDNRTDMMIKGDGSVGIGTSSPSVLIEGQTSTANSAYLRLGTSNEGSSHTIGHDIAGLEFYSGDGSGAGSGVKGSIRYKYGSSSGATTYMSFHTAGVSSGNDTERMRLDSSGNLLIGKTASGALGTAGIELRPNNLYVTSNSGVPIYVNRNTNDGDIINFNKDNTTVGSIGTDASRFKVKSNSVALYLENESNKKLVWGNVSGVPYFYPHSDNDTNIGYPTQRFKDLHLSGTANVGGLKLGDNEFILAGTGSDLKIGHDGTDNIIRSQGPSLYIDANNHIFRGYSPYTEAIRIDSSGNVLVGTTNTTPAFGTGNGTAIRTGEMSHISRSGGTPLALNRASSDGDILSLRKDGTQVGSISVTSSATAYNTSSDARLKDVTGEARGLEVITKLNPVAYNWKADGKADEGLIAQEVKELVPNAVTGSEDEHYQMDYSKLVTHLVKAVQELEQQTIELKEEIANLKGE